MATSFPWRYPVGLILVLLNRRRRITGKRLSPDVFLSRRVPASRGARFSSLPRLLLCRTIDCRCFSGCAGRWTAASRLRRSPASGNRCLQFVGNGLRNDDRSTTLRTACFPACVFSGDCNCRLAFQACYMNLHRGPASNKHLTLRCIIQTLPDNPGRRKVARPAPASSSTIPGLRSDSQF